MEVASSNPHAGRRWAAPSQRLVLVLSSQESRMKNLVLAALLGAVTASTACTSSTPTDAVVTAKWSFSTFANKDTATDPCPTNFTTASVHSKPWDPVRGEFVAGGVEVIDKFDCSAKIGTTD